MSACGQSGHTEEDSASEEAGQAGRGQEKTSDIYNQKPASKVVRVLTVLAYLLSVSLAAILLSVYYICVWKSPELPLSEPIEVSARRGNVSDYEDAAFAGHKFVVNGGGDTAVSNSTISSIENITTGYQHVNETDSSTETTLDIQLADTTPQGTRANISDDIGSSNMTGSVT